MKKSVISRLCVKLTVLLLCAAMITAVAGCGKNGGNSSGNSAGTGGDKDAITIGWVMPFTGALAEWTHTIRFVEEKALEVINNEKGGIYIKEYDKKLPIKIIWADSQSDAAKASEAARKLVLDDKVDFLVGMVTPDTINPVSAVAESNNIPGLMVSAPDSPWLGGGPYEWSYACLFSADTMMNSYTTAMTKIDSNKKVGIVFDNSVDGVTLSVIMVEYLEKKGFTVVDPGRFPQGTTDYTTLISKFKEEGCDIVTANLVDPDFATMWKQFFQQDYIPKLMNVAKAVHFTAGVQALGNVNGVDIGHGVITDSFWEPYYPFTNSLTGQSAAQMNKEFEDETGGFADTTLGSDWAAFEIIYDVYTRAQTLDKATVRDAIGATNLTGSLGQMKFADNRVFLFPIVTCQWEKTQDGRWIRNIIANDDFTNVPLSDKPIFLIPGSR